MIMKYYFGSQRVHIRESHAFGMRSSETLLSQEDSVNASPARLIQILLSQKTCLYEPPGRLIHKSCILDEDHVPRLRNMHPSTCERLHYDCVFPEEGDVIPDKANIELLSVNKQIHMEASYILYSTQTFSFNNPDTLRRFCNTISPNQRQALRKVDLSIEVMLQRKVGGPTEMLGLVRDWQWPEDALPERITDLGLGILIREPERLALFEGYAAVPDSSHVADGYFQVFHKALRWQFGFLRRLNNLRNAVVGIDDYNFQIHPDYLPVMADEFKAEILSHSVDEIFQAEAVEDAYREEQVRLIRELVYNPQEQQRLVRDLELCGYEVIRLESEMDLGGSRDALEEAKKKVEETQRKLSEAKAFDREAVVQRIELLKEKCTAHDKGTFRYLDEFDLGRGRVPG